MSENPGEIVRQRGLWFEELRTGAVYKHSPGRTLSEADNILFSTLTMNPQSLHLDAAFSETTEFGERLVNSLLTMSVLVGLSVGHLTQGTIVANLGFGDTRFPAPVRHGDTIYGETVILEKRLSSSRPGSGIVKFEHTARNQHGEVVAVVTRTTMMRCRPADEDAPDGAGQSAGGTQSIPADRPAPEDRRTRDDGPVRDDGPIRDDGPVRDDGPIHDDRSTHVGRPASEDQTGHGGEPNDEDQGDPWSQAVSE